MYIHVWTYTEIAFFSRKVQTHQPDVFVTSSQVTPRGGRRHIVRYCREYQVPPHHLTMLSLSCTKNITTMHMHSRRAEQWLAPSSTCQAGEQSNGSLHPAHAKPESRAMARSIQHMHSRRAEQWLAPSNTCQAGEQSNGSLHPAHAKPESRAMARSIQHMPSRRAEQWLAPSSTCQAGEQSNGSLHPVHAKPESRAMAHSIQHMHVYMYMCIHNTRLRT